MSAYGLIKETSRIKRTDTITDLQIVAKWRLAKGLEYICPKGPSIKKLEDAVALMCDCDTVDLPKLIRGIEFYKSIIKDIKP